MNPMTSAHRQLYSRALQSLFPLTIVLLWMVVGVNAQTSATDGKTPIGLAPGAPAGSFSVSGFENVNLFNGNLNFSLPLLKIGGRGGAQTGMALTIDSMHWTVERSTDNESWGDEVYNLYNPGNHPPIIGGGGGTSTSGFDVSPDLWKEGLRTGYGPGILQGRWAWSPYGSLTRLTFTASDGTEYELRDVQNNGKPLTGVSPNRGTFFVTAGGGSSMTFVSNQAISEPYHTLHSPRSGLTGPLSGYLMMADGTRYDISDGLVMAIRDRNGNQLTFSYYKDINTPVELWRVHTITDSLGRVVTVVYAGMAPANAAYDEISFDGFDGADRSIKIWRTDLHNVLRTDRVGDLSNTQTYSQLFYPIYGGTYGGSTGNGSFDPVDTVSAVELPDGRKYYLYYNVYGEVARVVLPTGGMIEYDYSTPEESVTSNVDSFQIHRRVKQRRVYRDSQTLESKQTYAATYTLESTNGNYQFWRTEVMVEQHDMLRDASDTLVNKSKHTFFGSPIPSLYQSPTSYSQWTEGREKQIETFDKIGTPLRKEEMLWSQCTDCELSIDWWTNPAQTGHTAENAPPNNPHVIESVVTITDVTPKLVLKQTFLYDKYNNLTDTYDYDYNPTVPAAYPVRHTRIIYLSTTDYTSASVHIRSLPTLQIVYSVNSTSGAETLAAKSELVYDETTYQVTEDYGTIMGWAAPATAARGNATTSKAWYDVNSSNGYIETHVQYDQCGNVRMAWDGRNKVSEIQYSATYNYALPTKTKTPKPDPNGVTGSSSELETISVYDFSTGLVTSSTDANGQTTSIEYNDVLGRPTRVTRPTGGGWTSFEYGDTVGNLYVRTQTALDASRTIEAYQYFDGLGRSWRSSQTEGTTFILADTQFDALGRVWKVSNPYRTGDTAQWTTTSYDALGRVTSVKTSDDAEVLTAYIGNTVTVTDQSGKQRKSVTDALGRLTTVYEAPNDTTYFNFQTSYVYDVLGNLRTVTQGSQKRYFLYDSLSRLIRVRNPEQDVNSVLNLSSDTLTENNSQWSLSYSYDNNGNLLTKTDARGTTASYSYDSLNRVTERSYSGGTAVATPTVNYFYDAGTVTNSKGRLTSISSSVSGYNYSGYDALGRITASQQVTDGQTYSMSYQYDLAGNMTSQTYPTGRMVTQSFDSAGRLAAISGQASGGTPKTYANSFGYTAHGAVERMRFGNERWEHTSFNNRLQPTEIGLGTSANDSSVLKLNYEYGTTANNGNVLKQVITVPTIGTATGFTATQHYQYDQLNRLTGAQEVNGESSAWQTSAVLWQQMFSYDRFGNRAVDTGNTTSTMIGPNPQISTSTNRIVPRTSPAEYYHYDNAGNLDKGQSGDTFAYDTENKLVQYQRGAAQSGGANYSYDGHGRRVKKATPAETLIFVYDISGQLVAEYTTSTTENNGTSYLTNDTLGTPRVITKADGSIKARHDYLPFGEELFANTGNRTTGQKYDNGASPADKTRQKFTSYERDNETGFDFAQERYYSSTQGRFTSVDPLMASARIENPQTLNRVIYVLNNPLRYVDKDGMQETDPWSKLTKEERKLLVDKIPTGLVRAGSRGQYFRPETTREAFNRMVTQGATGPADINTRILTVKNYMISTRAFSDGTAWRQTQFILSVSSSDYNKDGELEGGLEVLVKCLANFLDAMSRGQDAYDVDMYYDIEPFSYHPNNSLRERVMPFGQPGLHYVNTLEHPEIFSVHWDRVSSAWGPEPDGSPQKEILRGLAGLTHTNPYSATKLNRILVATHYTH